MAGIRGLAVASATAVTAVGAVVGMGGVGHAQQPQSIDAPDATLLTDVPAGGQAQLVSDNISQQAQAQQHHAAKVAAAKKKAAAKRKKAAEEAHKKAEAKKAYLARLKQQQEASRSESRTSTTSTAPPPSPGSVQALAKQIIGNETQYQCFSNIVERESGWNVHATNPSSGAYGLVQALPGSKMASVGSDWRTNPATQIKWGLQYMDSRYGSPCGAWSYWQVHHSY